RLPGIMAALVVGAGVGWLSDLFRLTLKQSRELAEQITQRRQTEEALRRARNELEIRVQERTTALNTQKDLYETLLKGQSDLGEGFLITKDQQIIYTNDAFCQMSGYSTNEILALPSFLDLVIPQERALLLDRLNHRALDNPVTDHFGTAILHKRGSRVELEIAVKLLHDTARSQRIVIVRDITERKSAENELRARERFLATLKDITRAAISSDDFKSTVQIVADRLGELIGADGCYITLWDEIQARTIPVAAYGPMRETYPRAHSDPGEITMTESVLRAGHALVAEDCSNTPYLSPRIAARYPGGSLLGLPLIAGNEKLGAALLGFNEPHHFSPDEIERGEEVARHIALAIAKVKSFDHAKKRLTHLSALYEIAHEMIASTDTSRTMELVCRHAAELLNAPKSIICAWDSPTKHQMVADFGLQDPERAKIEYAHQARKSVFDLERINDRNAFGINQFPVETTEMPEFIGREGIRSLAHAPLRVARNPMGVLIAFDTKPREWSEDELQMLDLLAHQAALLLNKTRLFEETQSSLAITTRLYHLSGQMLGATTLEETARVVTETLCDAFAPDVFSLELLDSSGHLEFQYGTGLADTSSQNTLRRPSELTWRVWESGELFVTDQPELLPLHTWTKGFCSAIVLPLRGKTHTLGVLSLQYRRTRTFNEHEMQLLSLFANQAAVTIENVRLSEEMRRRLTEMEAVNRISTALRSAQTLEDMLPLLLDETLATMKASAGSIDLVDPITSKIEHKVARGWYGEMDDPGLHVQEEIARHMLVTGQPYLVREFAREPVIRAHSIIPPGWGGVLVPIRAAQEIIGIFSVSVPLPREMTQEEIHLLTTLAEIAGNAIHRTHLHEQTERDTVELAVAYDATIEGWSRALDLRDKETEGHTRRVTEMTLRLARALGINEEELVHIRRGGLLHDIGKMAIPDAILLKPGPHDATEWAVMRKHPVYANDLLSPIPYLRPALDIPYHHHEKWDGTGYPHGLKGEEISLAVRIFAIVDVWDALTSDRPYRPAWHKHRVREYIRGQAGKHFDPLIVTKFLQIIDTE
ncbi:partial 3'3'-cGAMP-specific phosphodiesterase 2, partial [Anaerolineae bacterium]